MSITISAGAEINNYWTSFKSIAITTKALAIQYVDDGVVYTIFAFDGSIAYTTTIYHGTVPDNAISGGYSQAQNDSDKSDFETNVKPTANASLLQRTTLPSLSSNALAAISFGDVSLGSVTTAAVRRTAYTEQTTNFTGSVVSSSTSDTAAGTGAQTVTITYLDQTGAGPNTETVTLNGTTAVNLVNTNHCFIEKIVVATVGSGGSNVGTITLKTGAAGAGTTVGTIGAGDNRTFWAHHYVPTGKTNYLTSLSGTVVGGPGSFFIRAQTLNSAGSVEIQITDTVRMVAQSATTPRNYGTALRTVGPARILGYALTESSSTLTYRLSFDYYDV